jgi:chromosome segregation ATPase
MQVDDIVAVLATLSNAPDTTTQALIPVVDRLALVVDSVSSMHSDVTSLADSIAALRADRSQLVQISMETNGRLDLLAANLGEIRESRPDFTSSFIALSGLIESVQASVTDTHDRIDTLSELVRRVEGDQTDASAAPLTVRLDQLSQQLNSQSSDVKSTVRAVVGLGAEFAEIQTELRALSDTLPDRTDANAEVREALARLDATLANRDTSVRDSLSRLDAAIGQTSSESDFSDLARQLDAGMGELRRDLQGMYQTAQTSDVLDLVRSMSRDLGDLRADVRRSESELTGGASAALVASAASAMARLEERMDGEFDGVGRQMEALGTLLGQLIDAVHRIEAQVVGVQPVSDKMRSSAAAVLEALRANVRQRAAARRNSGAPPELGAGPR